jgi:hypothetical protein
VAKVHDVFVGNTMRLRSRGSCNQGSAAHWHAGSITFQESPSLPLVAAWQLGGIDGVKDAGTSSVIRTKLAIGARLCLRIVLCVVQHAAAAAKTTSPSTFAVYTVE